MNEVDRNTQAKITSFKDLVAWQKSYNLSLEVYRVTKAFPSEEKFALTNQLRRAVVSVSSNIAEGFARRSPKDKSHFFVMAKSSLSEVESQLLISHGLGYLSKTDLENISLLIVVTSKLLVGLIKSTRNTE